MPKRQSSIRNSRKGLKTRNSIKSIKFNKSRKVLKSRNNKSKKKVNKTQKKGGGRFGDFFRKRRYNKLIKEHYLMNKEHYARMIIYTIKITELNKKKETLSGKYIETINNIIYNNVLSFNQPYVEKIITVTNNDIAKQNERKQDQESQFSIVIKLKKRTISKLLKDLKKSNIQFDEKPYTQGEIDREIEDLLKKDKITISGSRNDNPTFYLEGYVEPSNNDNNDNP
jgi:hypothetical protein